MWAPFFFWRNKTRKIDFSAPLRLPSTFISINNFLPVAEDLPAPQPGWFSLTVLYAVHETCRMCDVVMDTLKKNHTIQAFHTAHIVLDRERNSNVTLHYIKAFMLPNMRQLFSSISFFFFFVIGNPAKDLCLLLPRNDPSAVSAYFFQTFQEREKKKNNLHLNISLRLRIVPVPHWTIYCCWLGQQGGVVFGVTVLQPEDLDSISRDSWNPPCWGALRIHGYKDAALKRRRTVINTEKAQKCTRTPSKWLRLILFVCTKSSRMFPLWFFSGGVEILHRCFIKHSALVCISEGSRLTGLPLKLYLITQKSKPPPEAVKAVNLIIPWLCAQLWSWRTRVVM